MTNRGPSLNEVLAQLGYTTEPGDHGAKRIMRDGQECFSGIADDVWKWLRRTKQVPRSD